MEFEKVIETINKYKTLLETNNPDKISKDDKFFVLNIELELAKAIYQDFDRKSSLRIGKILIACSED